MKMVGKKKKNLSSFQVFFKATLQDRKKKMEREGRLEAREGLH